MTILNPDHLLDQAERLATLRGSGPARRADLRRAISTAYYAVFHALATAAADHFVAAALRRTPRYQQVYRSIDHKRLRGVCEDLARSTPPAIYAAILPASGLGPDVAAVATAVGDLQEVRNLADYDSLFRAKSSEVALANCQSPPRCGAPHDRQSGASGAIHLVDRLSAAWQEQW